METSADELLDLVVGGRSVAENLYRPIQDNNLAGRVATTRYWIQCAFRIGDDTYLDFTGGERLYSDRVNYDPHPQETTLLQVAK